MKLFGKNMPKPVDDSIRYIIKNLIKNLINLIKYNQNTLFTFSTENYFRIDQQMPTGPAKYFVV